MLHISSYNSLRRLLPMLMAMLMLSLSACSNNDEPDPGPEPEPPVPAVEKYTLFVYMPWASDLHSFFLNNLADMETALKDYGSEGQRILVFEAKSSTSAQLFEITIDDAGKPHRDVIEEYTTGGFTDASGLGALFSRVMKEAPANSYSLAVGAHGMGWLPKPESSAKRAATGFKPHWEYEGRPLTRYFGSEGYQTDLSTLSEGLERAGMDLEFVLFDDCYMASVEVAYELRHTARYLIASTCEIMAYGMPYSDMLQYLFGKPDYEKATESFYNFYSKYQYPYGTLSVIDCQEVEALAQEMKDINATYTWDNSLRGSVQVLDGYAPSSIFFDFGDYVRVLTSGADIPSFAEALQAAVPYKVNTPQYYSQTNGKHDLKAFSGLTISDPSINLRADSKTSTAWWEATH